MGFLSEETIELIRQFHVNLNRRIEQRIEELLQAKLQETRATDLRTIGERLDAEVERLNITHEALADVIGVPRSSYFDVKRERVGPRSRSRRKIEQYFKSQAASSGPV
jgi:DNA-binding XRE family transcriptional regulator